MEPAVDEEGRRYELRPADCPTCGPALKRFVGIRGGSHHRYGHGIESRIVQCKQCTLLFPDPFPHPLDVQEMYGDPDKYFVLHGKFEEKSEGRRSLIREIKLRTRKSDPSILDIGSGRGETLRAAALERVTVAVGLELSRAMIDSAADHDLVVIEATAEQYAQETRSFDAIILAAVAEHVVNPDSLMAAVAAMTSPGAVLLIDVPREPNIITWMGATLNRIRRRAAVLNLSPTFSPFHVYGFNPRALAALLNKHGFVIEQLEVKCSPIIPHDGSHRDRAAAIAGSLAIRLGNWTRTAPNMTAWARRK